MTSIYEITSWSAVGSFLIWTLAVCAVAKALFGSLPAAELQYRLSLRDGPRRQQINHLNWEVKNRVKWDEDVARGSPHAAVVALSEVELKGKHRELQQLTRASFWRRAFTYFMGCFACQAFWTAVAVYAITRGVTESASWVFSAAAYSGAAVLVSMLYGSTQQQPDPAGRRPNSGGCGR